MPVMDGFESSRRILESQKDITEQATIIALTAFTNTDYKDQCLQAGIKSVLNKPAKAMVIKETV